MISLTADGDRDNVGGERNGKMDTALDDFAKLERSYRRRIAAAPSAFRRALAGKIDWADRLICVKGPRGVGKTTLLFQHIRETFPEAGKALYASLDHLWFATHDLEDLVEDHWTHGGTHVFLDEVHHLPEWQTRLKNLYDDFPELHFAYTGSSMLRIDRSAGDLSRRQAVYELPGLSFREYLAFEHGVDIPPLEFGDLLDRHEAIAEEICGRVKVLPAFETYLRRGYYPFFKETRHGYGQRLAQVALQVLEGDYPAVEEVTASTIRKAKKMLMILADRVPQKVNFEKLCRELETDRNLGLKMLDALERGGLLGLLSDWARSLKGLSRPEKIYLGDTNLMSALSRSPEAGTVRETFFFNQVRQVLPVHYPARGDFLVDGKWTFEVGGKGKKFNQIADERDGYLAVDGIETGGRHRIPLWMFGLLY